LEKGGAFQVKRWGFAVLLVAQMPADFIGIRQGDDVEIIRGDLADIFYQATAGDCEYIFGDSIRSMQEVEAGVEVELEHGGKRVFDLVIGLTGYIPMYVLWFSARNLNSQWILAAIISPFLVCPINYDSTGGSTFSFIGDGMGAGFLF
jgi:hypothetical protein